jgi:hypothetical protein
MYVTGKKPEISVSIVVVIRFLCLTDRQVKTLWHLSGHVKAHLTDVKCAELH